jgi:hypothetical protein
VQSTLDQKVTTRSIYDIERTEYDDKHKLQIRTRLRLGKKMLLYHKLITT